MSYFELFSRYPYLENKLLRIALGSWPTPLHPLVEISAHTGQLALVKRDDLSHPTYGGNKIRKLEFVLADVCKCRKKTIITAGALGSHHVLATAALSKGMGIQTVGLFFRQPVNDHVRENLLLAHYFGVKMLFVRDYLGIVSEYIKQYFSLWLREGHAPYVLVPGGSTAISSLGYVNAVLELQTQLKQQGLPDPEAIFVAAGSGGTVAGILAGLALSRMDTALYGIQVTPRFVLRASRVLRLAHRALYHLSSRGVPLESSVKNLKKIRFRLITEYLGKGYGYCTAEALVAMKSFKELETLTLEGCYTGKTAAAFIEYCKGRALRRNRPVIFFHTYSSTHKKFEEEDRAIRLKALPQKFYWCYENIPYNADTG